MVIDIQGKELQKYQLEVLSIAKDFASFCDNNNIFYTLSGGSVLGAVRHQGFIPWDDDIDINMPRDDYNKFVSLFEKAYGNKYYLQTPKNNTELGLLVTQIRKKGTIARRKYDINNKKCGISIDIYILENVYENPIAYNYQKIGSLLFPFLVSVSRSYQNRDVPDELISKEHRRIKFQFLRHSLGRLINSVSISSLIKISFYFFKLCKNNKSKTISIPTGRGHFNKEQFVREDLCQSTDLKFEDTTFKVPKNYKEYLTKLYGDYMVIPDKQHRERHLFLELEY